MTAKPTHAEHLTENLRRWLRNHRDGEWRLPRADAAALVEAIGRLQQSGARLRRQNKKLRARLAVLEVDTSDLGDADAEGALP